jgi:hypothetical protein
VSGLLGSTIKEKVCFLLFMSVFYFILFFLLYSIVWFVYFFFSAQFVIMIKNGELLYQRLGKYLVVNILTKGALWTLLNLIVLEQNQ